MDNQFRNVKTHARLLSKAMWYEWRMKLLEGLKQGLDRHVEEMKSDDSLLSKKEVFFQNVMPKLVKKQATLTEDAGNLERVVHDMENCDQEELQESRARLLAADATILEKKKQLEEMQALLRTKTDVLENGAEVKSQLMQQIDEAERTREECRGWSIKEVHKLKRKSAIKSSLVTSANTFQVPSIRSRNEPVGPWFLSRLMQIPVQ
jgi:kinetochore protein Spc7/SPC105